MRLYFLPGLLILSILFARSSASAQAIFYVTPSGAGDNSGSAWSNAAAGTQLQSLISGASANTQIWLAAGTYYPTDFPSGCTTCGPDTRNYAFSLKNGVALYGGFAGTETAVTQRLSGANLTFFSGDIGTAADSTDNSYHVVVSVSNNNTAVLNGISIINGHANGTDSVLVSGSYVRQGNGGGLYLRSTAASITGCSFLRNAAVNGGGVYTLSSSDSLKNCVFTANKAVNGGALYNAAFSGKIINGAIIANAATNGGAMYNLSSGSLNILNTTIFGNTASTASACYNDIAFPVFTNDIVWGNTGSPMGIYSTGSGYFTTNMSYSIIQDNTFTNSNLVILAPLFFDNTDPDGPDNILGTSDDGLRLRIGSPGINAGSNGAITGTPTDLIGGNRFQATTVDMGAYEGGFCTSPTILYVDSAVLSGTGGTWATAFRTLQDALTASACCPGVVTQIWIKKGTYYPVNYPCACSTNTKQLSLVLKNNVEIYGGFAGNETSLSQRNPALNKTIISGNLTDYHVFISSGNDSTAVIDGVTIAEGFSQTNGGTMQVNGRYVNNGYGSGLYCVQSSPTLRNVIFKGNKSALVGGTAYSAGGGAGMFASNSSPKLINCVFTGNSLSYEIGGPAVFDSASTCVFENCVFTANDAGFSKSEAIYNLRSSSMYRNCVLADNQGSISQNDGVIYNVQSTATLINCTVISTGDKSCYNTSSSTVTASNCLFVTTAAPEMYNDGTSSSTITYSRTNASGTGNITGSPLFVNTSNKIGADGIWGTADDGLQLSYCSPAIDAGSGTVAGTDITGSPRTVSGVVDMGAYEKQTVKPAAINSQAALPGSNGSTTSYTAACEDGAWTYYTINGNGDSVAFAISWNGNTAAKNAATLTTTNNASNTAQTNTTAGTWAMRRYWNVNLNGQTLSTPVSIRFFYDAADTVAMTNAAIASGIAPVSNITWFKTTGVAYTPTQVYPTGISVGNIVLTPSAGGTDHGVAWVQFDNITSFSGGTAMINAGSSTPLPVKLISFEASPTYAGTGLLQWNVADEAGVASYVVERSGDARQFSNIGSVDAIQAASYRFEDGVPMKGTNYYRLKMLEQNGQASYSQIRQLNFSTAPQVVIAPNPADNKVTIRHATAAGTDGRVVITDISGRVVYDELAKDELVLNISQWPSGMYIVKTPGGTVSRLIRK